MRPTLGGRARHTRARAVPAALAAACVVVALGCGGGPDPYCSEYDDMTGRGVALCRDLSARPVCDAPGDTARFERDASGNLRLVGGDPATCDEARAVVCADPDVLPRCVVEPSD